MDTEYATCTTPDCASRETPIPILRTDETVTVTCGACSFPVTNITDIKPTEGTVLPEWISEMLTQPNSDN